MATEGTASTVQRGPGLFVSEIYMAFWVPNHEVQGRGRQGALQSLIGLSPPVGPVQRMVL